MLRSGRKEQQQAIWTLRRLSKPPHIEQQQSTGVRYALLLLWNGTATTHPNATTYRRSTRTERQQQIINLLRRNGSTNQPTTTHLSSCKSGCCRLLGQQQEIGSIHRTLQISRNSNTTTVPWPNVSLSLIYIKMTDTVRFRRRCGIGFI